MLQYATLCYLQNYKTGSTFVERFLFKFCKEPLEHYEKHGVPGYYDPSRYYFINIRQPLDIYASQFAYGLDGRGGIWEKICKRGYEELYAGGLSGFDDWLRFMLGPALAEILPEFSPWCEDHGLMSWRFRNLAQFGFTFDRPAVSKIVRYELLTRELADLVDGPLAHAIRDHAAAKKWLRDHPAINASSRVTGAIATVSLTTIELLLLRERYLFESFYPDTENTYRAYIEHDQTAIINLSNGRRVSFT